MNSHSYGKAGVFDLHVGEELAGGGVELVGDEQKGGVLGLEADRAHHPPRALPFVSAGPVVDAGVVYEGCEPPKRVVRVDPLCDLRLAR